MIGEVPSLGILFSQGSRALDLALDAKFAWHKHLAQPT